MSIDPIPVHRGLAPADHGYRELEVDPWPHIHVWDAEDNQERPVVRVRLARYEGWPRGSWSRQDREEIERWTITVRSPGRLTRVLAGNRVTLESRIQDAIETLRERWDDLVEQRRRAFDAAVRYDEPGR